MISLKIPNNGELRLEFDGKVQRFSMCKFVYINDRFQTQCYEDYLYVFVENMLGRLKKLPQIEESHLFGVLGKWQESYYFKDSYIKKHLAEIEIMEKAIFVSTESFGTFLYEFDNEVWIEINKGYDERKDLTPMKYYSNTSNYRILLAPLSNDVLSGWRVKLEDIKKQYV